MKKDCAVASARKSKNEYKPIIVYPNGKTEVVEQNPERFGHYTKNGYIPGNKYARGNTYESKEDAIKAAQNLIDYRLQETINRFNKFSDQQKEKSKNEFESQLKLWGGRMENTNV